jgi:hypothetical protein
MKRRVASSATIALLALFIWGNTTVGSAQPMAQALAASQAWDARHLSYFIGNDPAQWRAAESRIETNVWASKTQCLVSIWPFGAYPSTGSGRRSTDALRKSRQVSGAGGEFSSQSTSDLLYATFLGGSHNDWGSGIAVGSDGAVYVTGGTRFSDFPAVLGSFDTTFNGFGDAFVVKLDPSGSKLIYATFLGGNGIDWGSGIAVDESGAVYVTGGTDSSDFPTTLGAFDTTFNGSSDAFAVKLDPSGRALLYATYLGGSDTDGGSEIVVDGSGAAYVTGVTGSPDFPTTQGAFDRSLNGHDDAFAVKLDPAGRGLLYATFLGGSGDDGGFGLAVDVGGNAYVTGDTHSFDFPTTPAAFDTTLNSAYGDAFVLRLNRAGSGLLYSTFLGGSGRSGGRAIAVDGSGSAYVTGETTSSDFPATPGAFDTTFNGSSDAFVVKLNPSGRGLLYATFLGGSGSDGGFGIAVDGSGAAYVTGQAGSSDLPTTPGAFDTGHNGGWDAFVVRLNPSGRGLLYATFLGGSGDDEGSGIAVDGGGVAYVTGDTSSSDFPATPGAFDTSYYLGSDAFVVKLGPLGPDLAPAVMPTRLPPW